jgi:hypothetical protein
MKSVRSRLRLQVVGALLSMLVALTAALAMRDRVRMVDILALFAGGMGAGVSLVQLAQGIRRSREAARDHVPE